MSDDLVERVAKAMCGCEGICFTSCGTEPCQMAEENYAKAARAAIAVALEEAAKVCDAYEPRCDVCPRGVAAAIRALIKEPTPGSQF